MSPDRGHSGPASEESDLRVRAEVQAGVQAADITEVRWLAGVRVRPGHREIVVIETRLDPVGGRLRGELLLVDPGEEPSDEPVVTRVAGDSGADIVVAAWSPGGDRLAVVDRAGALWVWTPPDGPFAPLAGPPVVGEPSWTPDGCMVAVPVVDPGGDSGVCLVDVATGARAVVSAAGRDLRWSPTGHQLAFVVDHPDGDSALVIRDLECGEDSVRLHAGIIAAPVWSPDGARMATIAADDAAANRRILVVGALDGAVEDVTAHLDLSFGTCVQSDDPRGYGDARLCWPDDGQGLVAACARGGRGTVLRVPIGPAGAAPPVDAADLPQVIGGDRAAVALDAWPDGTIAAIISDPGTPGELYLLPADGRPVEVPSTAGRGERRITATNRVWTARRRLATVEHLGVLRPTGSRIDAWLALPHRAPRLVLLSVHGGPHWPCGWRFSFDHQRLAATGIAVVTANPTGSGGYGEQHTRAVQRDWGGPDREDLMRVVAEISRRPELSGLPWAVTGVSYGGYLAALLLATTDMFCGGIVENGITDLARYAVTAGATAAGRRYVELELGSVERFRSPVDHVDGISSPVLLIHAEQDRNCPIEQAEVLLAALRSRGRRADLVRVPDEGHLMVLDGTLRHRTQRWAAVDRFLAGLLPPGPAITSERNSA